MFSHSELDALLAQKEDAIKDQLQKVEEKGIDSQKEKGGKTAQKSKIRKLKNTGEKARIARRCVRVLNGKRWVDKSLDEWPENDYRIYCCNLGNEVTYDHLHAAFSKYPSFLKAKVVRDGRTQRSRGYGFVSFGNSADYLRAMKEVNGKYIGKMPIRLMPSKWKSRSLENHEKDI